ncbi:embryogenesis-associated protein EMB8-like isoform X3 [Malania oleifera]|uniref:embryogenesis-associated protein EMB8-like isoform X2 n=1 Tax=Malania oleifera TaxID=397392 RepID=UPI0025ADE405|nr:embryogenesis-associated protein EMB8-like isoform X2 [Malania oleifera]XP_057977036.1 embryogenesis-associated protein EMB8-like isoform X3 [Malania oleifera]
MDPPLKLFFSAASLIPAPLSFLAVFLLTFLLYTINSSHLGHLHSRLFATAAAAAASSADIIMEVGGGGGGAFEYCSSPSSGGTTPYLVLVRAASLIPRSHYYFALSFLLLIFLYSFFELHLLWDLFTGFRGGSVSFTFHPSSELYHSVVSQCKVLHGRYVSTPWLASPHLQTAFQGIFGRAPAFTYKRELFRAPDGGMIALDWLRISDGVAVAESAIQRDDKSTPIVIVIPGVASDSSCAYVKHIAYQIAKRGWNVCVSNHRGFGGVPITSDCFGNAGWTKDLRKIVNSIHCKYPETPLYAVGTSIGANILVKYLGEDGVDVPLIGAAAICCPWDLLVGNRFLHRRFVQKFYDIAITFALKSHAQQFKSIYSRLANWEGIMKAHSLRDFDYHATCPIGNIRTVDTYYRHSSSVNFVGNVAVPLLCLNTLDDPVCTSEAIPWDECRENKNIVLVTTQHGGHVAHYEGLTAKSMWWVRATDEFLRVIHSSQMSCRKKEVSQLGEQIRLADREYIDYPGLEGEPTG